MVFASLEYEEKLWGEGKKLICGVDEVGRGCFAGPVVAGAVIFSSITKPPIGIADSKLLKPKKREELAEQIKSTALAWSVAEVDVETINEAGIGKATQLCFSKVVSLLVPAPDFILIDAYYIHSLDKRNQLPIIKGDQVSVSIAAASIIAKVYRDGLMEELELHYPGYGFSRHKGYGTKEHRSAIKALGLSNLHRRSFNLEKFLN